MSKEVEMCELNGVYNVCLDKSGLRNLLSSEEPLILEDFEGSNWMRGSCDKRALLIGYKIFKWNI